MVWAGGLMLWLHVSCNLGPSESAQATWAGLGCRGSPGARARTQPQYPTPTMQALTGNEVGWGQGCH